MNPTDPLLLFQLPLIQKIIQDETWLEGERRGCWVSPTDPAVKERVCQIVLRIGGELRQIAENRLATENARRALSEDERRAA